jgi:nitrate/nitrite transporter NarK
MPFMFVRVYQDSNFSAGLRLSIVPVMLGLVAPVGGALYDRLGARLLTALGHADLRARLALLFAVMDGTQASLALVMLAAGHFRRRTGVFHLTQQQRDHGGRAASLTGEAGGLLNVMRSLGISVGVAAASSLLAWRLAC